MNKSKYFAIALCVASLSNNAFAGIQTWDFENSGYTSTTTLKDNKGWNKGDDTITVGNGISLDQHGVNLTIGAWSSSAENPCSASALDKDACITDAYLKHHTYQGDYYGLGVISKDEDYFDQEESSPNHAIDSFYDGGLDNDFDMVLLTFDHAVNLKSLDIGWAYQKDGPKWTSDISVLAFDDNSGADHSFNGGRWEDITSSGWSSISNYRTSATNSVIPTTGNKVFSKHWLVGAYNSVFGGNLTGHRDAFKLAGLVTEKLMPKPPTEVPAPAGIVLLLVAISFMRKKLR